MGEKEGKTDRGRTWRVILQILTILMGIRFGGIRGEGVGKEGCGEDFDSSVPGLLGKKKVEKGSTGILNVKLAQVSSNEEG